MALFIVMFLVALALNGLALRKITLTRLSFIDGLVIGMTYYLSIPMIAILIAGRVGPDFVPIDDYLPYRDTTTTSILILFIAMLSLVRMLLPKLAPGAAYRPAYSTPLLSVIVAVLYFVTTTATFIMSGVAQGEHWFRASHELMQEDTNFLLLKIVANFTRTAVFGCLAILSALSPRYRRFALIAGAVICLFDLVTTFNRIGVVYFLLLAVICFRRHLIVALSAMAVMLFGGVYFSTLFTDVRGLISVYGYTVNGVSNAVETALANADESQPFVDQMNGVFESINITVFNYVVDNRAAVATPTGSYFIRPLTVVMPRALLPNRPDVFGLTLGRQIAGSDDLALNSTLLGEPYANSPVLWPGLLLVVVTVYQLLFAWLARANRSYGAIGAFVAFAFWRFDSSFAATSAIMCLLLHAGLKVLSMGRRDLRRAASRRRGPAERLAAERSPVDASQSA